MKLAIMQPYFLPYIGYFQLIRSAEVLVLYDNIEYTKKGWINRNRILQHGQEALLSLPLASGSDYLHIGQRQLAANFDRAKLLRQIEGAYRRAPFFAETWPLVQDIVQYPDQQLFNYLHHSIVALCQHLALRTTIVVSSSVPIDHSLKGADKVLALCHQLGASDYINSIGGQALYSKEAFLAQQVRLHFIRSQPLSYPQFGAPCIPWLSLLDVLMFNGKQQIMGHMIDAYDLI